LHDRFERQDLAFHQRVRQGYLEMAKKEPERWLVIDAALPRKEVGRLIWERVQFALRKRN
jgi:dTMP kinase